MGNETQVLRMPLFQLPQLLNQIVNAQVALGRLQELLAADSQDPIPQLPPAKEGETHMLKTIAQSITELVVSLLPSS